MRYFGVNMSYLKCKKCGDKYKLKKGELPEDFSTCHCGGELEYHLSSNELIKREIEFPSEINSEEIEMRKSRDRKVLRIILITGIFLIIALPVCLIALLIYRAYTYPMP